MIKASKIYKSFGDTPIFRGIDISIEKGQITALIGPSGSGKSTLLKILSLLETPESGSLQIEDNTYEFPLPSHNHIQYPWPDVTVVFQNLFLWPHLTLRQNILLPLQSNHRKYLSLEELDNLIVEFDMGDFIDRYPNQASVGQRQRAAIVRALMLNPKYLLLDEITSALDLEHINCILNHLLKLKEKGTGILLITHLIGFARNAADKIVFLENGHIIDSGGKDILESPDNPRIRKFLSYLETSF